MVEKPVQQIFGGGRNSITAGPLLVQDRLLLAPGNLAHQNRE
jgi:hypothetical protein